MSGLRGENKEAKMWKDQSDRNAKKVKEQAQEIADLRREVEELKRCASMSSFPKKGGAAGSVSGASVGGASVSSSAPDASSLGGGATSQVIQLRGELKETKKQLEFATTMANAVMVEAVEELERRKLLLAQERLQFGQQQVQSDTTAVSVPTVQVAGAGNGIVVGGSNPVATATAGDLSGSSSAIQAMVRAATTAAMEQLLSKTTQQLDGHMKRIGSSLESKVEATIGRAISQSPQRSQASGEQQPPLLSAQALTTFHKSRVQGVAAPSSNTSGAAAQEDSHAAGKKRPNRPVAASKAAAAVETGTNCSFMGATPADGGDERPATRRRLETPAGQAEEAVAADASPPKSMIPHFVRDNTAASGGGVGTKNRGERRAAKVEFGADIVVGFVFLCSKANDPTSLTTLDTEVKAAVRKELRASQGWAEPTKTQVDVSLAQKVVEWVAIGCPQPAVGDDDHSPPLSSGPPLSLIPFETLGIWSHYIEEVRSCLLASCGVVGGSDKKTTTYDVETCGRVVESLSTWAVEARGRNAYQSVFVVLYDCVLAALCNRSSGSMESLLELLLSLVSPLAQSDARTMAPMQAAASSGLLGQGLHCALTELLKLPSATDLPQSWTALCQVLGWNPTPLGVDVQTKLWAKCLDVVTNGSDSQAQAPTPSTGAMREVPADALEAVQCLRLHLQLRDESLSSPSSSSSSSSIVSTLVTESVLPRIQASQAATPKDVDQEERWVTLFAFLALDASSSSTSTSSSRSSGLLEVLEPQLTAFLVTERSSSTAHCHLVNSLLVLHKKESDKKQRAVAAGLAMPPPAVALTRLLKQAQKWWDHHKRSLQPPQLLVSCVSELGSTLAAVFTLTAKK